MGVDTPAHGDPAMSWGLATLKTRHPPPVGHRGSSSVDQVSNLPHRACRRDGREDEVRQEIEFSDHGAELLRGRIDLKDLVSAAYVIDVAVPGCGGARINPVPERSPEGVEIVQDAVREKLPTIEPMDKIPGDSSPFGRKVWDCHVLDLDRYDMGLHQSDGCYPRNEVFGHLRICDEIDERGEGPERTRHHAAALPVSSNVSVATASR